MKQKRYISSSVLAVLLTPPFVSLIPLAVAEQSAVYQWQMQRLMSPDAQTLEREQQQQQVFIYENLHLEDVEKALDEQFSRMENMMFTGTMLPPTAAGEPMRKEDDGCD